VNERGVFAALTNVSCANPDPDSRSRGLLVLEALGAASAVEAAEKISNLAMGAYNPFNLLIADREAVFAFTYEEAARPVPVEGGVIVVGNAPLDASPPPKLKPVARQALALARSSTDVLQGLAALCRGHRPGPRGPLDALCVHTPRYGTRSSALLRLGEGGLGAPESVLQFSDGPPCETDYRDLTPLLRDLDQGSPGVNGALSRKVH